MGGGNAQKTAMARAKNAKAAKSVGSQKASNQAAQTIQCVTCKNTFQSTTKTPQLLEHAVNKHSKDLATCFPGHIATA